MNTVPARSQSPFGESISAETFTASDHTVLRAFRNRMRRKAIWAVITPLHQQFVEAVEVYRPFEVPGKAEPTWTMWPSALASGSRSENLVPCANRSPFPKRLSSSKQS